MTAAAFFDVGICLVLDSLISINNRLPALVLRYGNVINAVVRFLPRMGAV
jgi:hypothetical protein